MRAAIYEKNGPAADVLAIEEIDTPEPGPGEVRVKLATSGVNPSDAKARGGARPVMQPFVIPHSDGAGEIDAVGPGVDPGRLGERVWTWNGQWKRPFGTAAEFIVLPAEQAVRLPDNISLEAGACLGIPALTAWHAVAMCDVPDGGAVLIPGGAGGVAHYAIQFAKARGLTVLSTVSSPEKAKIAAQAGADHTIDYKREDVAARVKEVVPNGVDAVIELDLQANATLLPEVVRPRGKVVVYGVSGAEAALPVFFFLRNAVTLRFIYVYELEPQERAAAIADITVRLEQDTLRHNVALTLPLDEAVAAHEAVERGSTAGNVVLRI